MGVLGVSSGGGLFGGESPGSLHGGGRIGGIPSGLLKNMTLPQLGDKGVIKVRRYDDPIMPDSWIIEVIYENTERRWFTVADPYSKAEEWPRDPRECVRSYDYSHNGKILEENLSGPDLLRKMVSDWCKNINNEINSLR